MSSDDDDDLPPISSESEEERVRHGADGDKRDENHNPNATRKDDTAGFEWVFDIF